MKGTKIHINVKISTHKLYEWILQNLPPSSFNIAGWSSSANEGKTDFDYVCNYDEKAFIVAKIG